MTIEKLKLEFFEFYQCNNFTLMFYPDVEDNKIIFKIYKDNISLKNHRKIIDKIKELELNKNEEIKFTIIYKKDDKNKENEENEENKKNKDNRHILNFEEYSKRIKEEYKIEINKLEYIIKKQIKKFYGKIINSNYIICGNEMPPKEINEEEIISWALTKKRVDFSYIHNYIYNYICITVDEHWINEELDDFLNKTINQKDIIEAINSKLIELKISGIHAKRSFKSTEFTTKEYKEWRKEQNLFIKMLENKLKNIGILEFNLEELK